MSTNACRPKLAYDLQSHCNAEPGIVFSEESGARFWAPNTPRARGLTGHVNGLPPYDDLPETVLIAFRDRTMLSMKELATALEMHVTTLRAHVANGDISGRYKGLGKIKPRICFTISDVAKYFRAPCNTQSDRSPNYRIEKRAPPIDIELLRSLSSPRVNITIRKRRSKRS
jgi:hypothetical protein